MIVGLTGGIACGKSTVAKLFDHMGCIIVDADQVAREVVEPGEEGLDAVVRNFGTQILNPDGTLNRKKLGDIVFSDPKARHKLNAILHPLIRTRMEEKKEQAQKLKPPLIILDIPLLLESKQPYQVEAVIVVYVPEEVQLKRLMERDQISAEEAMKRIKSQMPIDEKAKLADFVIDNSGTLEETKEQVEKLFKQLATR